VAVANTVRALPARFDPRRVAAEPDPYPVYQRMRAEGPLLRAGPAQWVVTRHAEASMALTDSRLGGALPEPYHRLSTGDGPAGEFSQRILLYQDQPVHGRLRRLLGTPFGNAGVQQLQPKISTLADDLLHAGQERGALDLAADLAVPLPLTVMCHVLGVPDPVRDAALPWLLALGRTLVTHASPAEQRAADDATTWLRDCMSGLLSLRRRQPADDLLTQVSGVGGLVAEFGDEEIVDNLLFLLFAGFETTSSLIANGAAALLANPGELARMRAEPSLLATAVEEFLRYDAPIQSRVRMVRSTIVIGERTLRPGRIVLVLLGSANRDERVFTDPDRLDVARSPNPHVSFGGGRHFCLGATLARLEAALVFGRLIARFDRIEPAAPAVRSVTSTLRTYSSVPALLRSAVGSHRDGGAS
jgi:cytochrome P450